ncbi:hypothetical protein [Burkholderia pseudomallei]|uniref:hypothetical protein n=1 Tax=Burkholderia pseudomallei TaxID=28450 RepID=UPI0012F4AC13|nr:hypothetical protein [Burkholderia pseudomallei]
MTEREEFEDWWISEGPNTESTYEAALSAWEYCRRTTPDREAIIEECMETCRKMAEYFEEESPPQASPTRKQAAGARACLAAIKLLKTAPNGDKG